MKCPYCGFENIAGEDSCESCGEDLTALDTSIQPESDLEAALLETSIADIPPPEAIHVARDTTIAKAAQQMNKHKIGCVVVVDKKKLVGIVSERDILFKAFQSKEADLEKLTVEALMTPSPETLNQDDSLAYALNRMSLGGYRHIPIMKGTDVVGLVSVQNIFRYVSRHLHSED